MAKIASEKPWWLETGHEHCSACGHTYVYETAFYCAGCDGPMCWICVEDVSGDVLCVGCKCSDKDISAGSSSSDVKRMYKQASR